jgi:Hydrazine synthase alpha subunit middle domain
MLLAALCLAVGNALAAPRRDIVFVTQIPIPRDFATVNATFANHSGAISDRGFGDLWIRYNDGVLRNLTHAGGLGGDGLQGDAAIAVRDPAVHWSGAKLLVSIVTGAPSKRYEVKNYFWQIYEVTKFGKGETPIFQKIANQPADYNNVMAIYGSNSDEIFFISDRPRNGARHLYPQRDEYESTPTNTGLWRLHVPTGQLVLLDHAPSGDFHPFLDSYGRVIMTRWDHLERDQQADAKSGVDKGYGAFNYSDESAEAQRLTSIAEHFPEHEDRAAAAENHPNLNEHRFNHFFPWMINQDGTDLETLNHLGRHELHSYLQRSFKDDSALDDFYGQYTRTNKNPILNFFHIREDPLKAGRYFGIDCPEFGTHTAGQIVSMESPPEKKASAVEVVYQTHRSTAATSNNPPSEHVGLFRNPLPLSDGGILAAHTFATEQDSNIGTSTAPRSKYAFRLRELTRNQQGYLVPGAALTDGISKTVSYWSPDELYQYSGEMWELQPVEIVSRAAPPSPSIHLPAIEAQVFQSLGVSVESVRELLRQHDAALIIGRDVTVRDALDMQQPFNLKVELPGGKSTVGGSGKIYPVRHLQIFQGDQLRGYGSSSGLGRRVLAVPLHDRISLNPPNADGPSGSVPIFADGSYAAIVPARRALSWQLTDKSGVPSVRERYWVTFQPGEVRVCSSCHGVTSTAQNGAEEPVNSPAALGELLRTLSNLPPAPPIPEDPSNPGAPTPSPEPEGVYSVRLKEKRGKRGSSIIVQVSRVPSTAGTLSAFVSVKGSKCAKKPRELRLSSNGTGSMHLTLGGSQRVVGVAIELRLGDHTVYKKTVKHSWRGDSALSARSCKIR